ncbi:MAG TPA: VCBS repeat-containing protein [Pyrinomonadaceae bacterium]|nr:VCBS repeat-containing protein [Pyrinomonadaceae bacterium]
MKKKLLMLLFTLGLTAAAAPHVFAAQPPPNYMASVDGYAPADYDGDGVADFAIKDFSGAWAIDYAANGFGTYDEVYFGYGGQNNLPVPQDYDGDGRADLAVKSNDQGRWNIDYAYNGYGVWDVSYAGYGSADNRPVPADYDGDGLADFAVKSNSQGRWNIDFAANGFGVWDLSRAGYGGAENIPVPADFDADGKADFAIWAASGVWAGTFNIDYARNGFGAWDASLHNVLPGPGRPAAGNFDGDCYMDFSVKRDDGSWHILLQGSGGSYPPNCFLGSTFLGFRYVTYYGYGGGLHRPVPARYDADAATDLAVRAEVNPTSFAVDYAFNGFGAWDAVHHP